MTAFDALIESMHFGVFDYVAWGCMVFVVVCGFVGRWVNR